MGEWARVSRSRAMGGASWAAIWTGVVLLHVLMVVMFKSSIGYEAGGDDFLEC